MNVWVCLCECLSCVDLLETERENGFPWSYSR